MEKKLAIVIPYFKIQFFEECLQSLYSQTNKNFNIYIGNDNSPDDPKNLINEFEGELNIIYKNFENNLGKISLVNQWERCLELVNEETWIMILGDDDKISSDCVDSFYKSLDKVNFERCDVIRFASQKIDKNGDLSSPIFKHPLHENSKDFIFRKFRGETRSSLSEYIFKKKAIFKTKFKEFPLGWHSDDLAILECSKFERIYSINDAVVYFRNSGVNITSLKSNLIDKNEASFRFYIYLLKVRADNFNIKEKRILFQKLEKTYLNDKKSLFFFWEFTKVNFKHLRIMGYTIFWKKFFKYIKEN